VCVHTHIYVCIHTHMQIFWWAIHTQHIYPNRFWPWRCIL